MTRVDLPSGGWFETSIDPAKLRQKDLDAYCLASESSASGWESNFAVRQAQLAMVVDTWSFDLAVPRDAPAAVGELVPADVAAIRRWFLDNVDPVFFPSDAGENPLDPKADPPA